MENSIDNPGQVTGNALQSQWGDVTSVMEYNPGSVRIFSNHFGRAERSVILPEPRRVLPSDPPALDQEPDTVKGHDSRCNQGNGHDAGTGLREVPQPAGEGGSHATPVRVIGQTLQPAISPKQKRNRSLMVVGSLSSGIGTNPKVL